MAELRHRDDKYMADLKERPRPGWYTADLPAPLHASYLVPLPDDLDLAETPVFLGFLPGGDNEGDSVERPLICGHSLETHGWTALIQVLGVGFSSFDLREVIDDQPLPTEEGSHVIAPHSFGFQVDGVTYQYVVTSVGVGLVKLWRPDLVEFKDWLGESHTAIATVPDEGDADAVWPVLTDVTGLLFASEVPRSVMWRRMVDAASVRDPVHMADALRTGSTSFLSGRRPQPIDLSATPRYLGSVVDYRTEDSGDVEILAHLQGETLTLTYRGRGTATVDLGPWLDRQSGELDGGLPLISEPAIDFTHDGVAYRIVVESLIVGVDRGPDGRLVFDADHLGGQLFAALAAD